MFMLINLSKKLDDEIIKYTNPKKHKKEQTKPKQQKKLTYELRGKFKQRVWK